MVGLTRSAALEFSQQNIHISSDSPRLIATEILANVLETVVELYPTEILRAP